MLTPETLRERLIAIEVKPEHGQGCSEVEIGHVRTTSGLPLPLSYVNLLHTIGKGAGRFMRDISMFYPDMIGLNAEAADVLNDWEEGRLVLPDHAFVFTMRYREQFTFFIADGRSNDPPIFYYFEGDHRFTHMANSLWDMIEGELVQSEQYYRESHDDPDFRAFRQAEDNPQPWQ